MSFVPVDIKKIKLDNAQPELPHRGRTALEQGLQGATFNFGDEAYNRLGALGAYGYQALTDLPTASQDPNIAGYNLGAVGRGINSLQELTNQASDATNERLAQQMEQRPALSIGSQIAGALATGGLGASTKSGSAIANSIRNSGLAGRVAKTGVLGAAAGSVAGAGSGSGAENRLEGAGSGAVAGGLVSGALPVAGSVAGEVVDAFRKSPKVASADDIKLLANEAYEKAAEVGGTLKGWFTNQFLDSIKDIQPAKIAGKQVPTDPKLAEALEYVNGFKNTRLSLQDAQNLDEYLSDAIDGFTTLGQVNKSGTKLLDVQRKFRNMIEDADESLVDGSKEGFEALKKGRQLWSAQYKMRDIERVIKNAELADNPATAIKTGMKNILLNAKKSKGYTKDELKLIERAANSGIATDVMRTFGSRLLPIITGAGGGGIGATLGAAAGSTASRGIATRMQLSKADDVARAISNRASPQPVNAVTEYIAPRTALGRPVAGGSLGTMSQQEPMPANAPESMPGLPAGFVPVDMKSIQLDAAPQANANPLSERIKQAESGGDPYAKNPNSSAAGLYQFTDSTWRSAVDKWGRRQGIKYSDKANPQAQEAMMQYLTQDNARILQNKGIEPNDQNLYFAHFLGAPAASKAIGMLGKNAIAARSFPSAASANKEIFYDGSRPRTIDEVYQIITSKVG